MLLSPQPAAGFYWRKVSSAITKKSFTITDSVCYIGALVDMCCMIINLQKGVWECWYWDFWEVPR